jgi:GntR family transcriptional regulator, arabinose operon transcriptional repressor
MSSSPPSTSATAARSKTMKNLSPRAPLYARIEEYLRGQIDSGAWPPGTMLPSVRELCEHFGGVNHLTVRQALKNLAKDGLVRSEQGRGTFVQAAKTRHGRIAIVLPNIEDPLFVRIARGATRVLESLENHAVILDSDGDWNRETSHVTQLRELPLDGALIFPLSNSDLAEQVFKLKLDGFPFVLVDRHFDFDAPCVAVDNFGGGKILGEYLAARGRKRIAWIGELDSTAARLRCQGLNQALDAAGLALPRSYVREVALRDVGSSREYRRKLRDGVSDAWAELKNQTPDAIVCGNDLTAFYLLEILERESVEVPGRISVCGFDDAPGAENSRPPLTTIRQPMEEVGEEAARRLLEW